MIGYMPDEFMAALLAACVMACFFVGYAMDGVMGRTGFGVLGNMLILITGLFLGVFGADLLHMNIGQVEILVGSGLVGAFVSLMTLTLLKFAFLSVD